MEKRKFDLEDRFVEYTCRMIDIVAISAKNILTKKK